MAIVKFGTMVVGIRGTIGGLTFTVNKSGPYVRTWSKGANPRSADQSETRSILATVTQQWRNLSQTQRDDWDTFAADPAQELTNSLGEPYFISGFNWFTKINNWRFSVGQTTFRETPPATIPGAGAIDEFTYATGSPPQTELTITEALAPQRYLVVFARIMPTVGAASAPHNQTLVYVELGDGAITQFDLTQDFENAFGPPIPGNRAFITVLRQRVADGRRSTSRTASADAP